MSMAPTVLPYSAPIGMVRQPLVHLWGAGSGAEPCSSTLCPREDVSRWFQVLMGSYTVHGDGFTCHSWKYHSIYRTGLDPNHRDPWNSALPGPCMHPPISHTTSHTSPHAPSRARQSSHTLSPYTLPCTLPFTPPRVLFLFSHYVFLPLIVFSSQHSVLP